jgi:hypothetical protein
MGLHNRSTNRQNFPCGGHFRCYLSRRSTSAFAAEHRLKIRLVVKSVERSSLGVRRAGSSCEFAVQLLGVVAEPVRA